MSIQTGDRATYRGESVVVIGPAPYLFERRWHVRYRNGKAPTGWTRDEAPESALANSTRPTWEVDDSVHVGWTPFRTKGTVTAVGTDEAGRAKYTVLIPAETRTTDEGTRWNRDAYSVIVGAEELDT